MSKNYALKAEKRERAGKGVARSLRRAGRSPAVVYGDNKEPVKISLSENEINVFIKIKIRNKKKTLKFPSFILFHIFFRIRG